MNYRSVSKSLEIRYFKESSWRLLLCLVLGTICQRWQIVAQSTLEHWEIFRRFIRYDHIYAACKAC